MDKNTSKERGEAFIKAIVKSAMVALISIGIRTEDNINRFMIRFEEEMEKRLKGLGMMTDEGPPELNKHGKLQEVSTDPAPLKDKNPEFDQAKVTLKDLKLHPFVQKHLKAAGIDNLLKLIEAMQKDDLTKIKGIKEASAEKIREAVKNYQPK